MSMESVYDYLKKNKGWHYGAKISKDLRSKNNGSSSILNSLKSITYYDDILCKTMRYRGNKMIKYYSHARWKL